MRRIRTKTKPNFLNPYALENEARKWLVLRKVRQNGFALRDVPVSYRDNADVVRAAVYKNGEALRYASDRLKDDKITVLISLKSVVSDNPIILIDVSLRLRDDRDVVLAAVRVLGGKSIQYASHRLRSNIEFMSVVATQHDWRSIRWACADIRDDETIMTTIVEKHGSAIRFASDRLKDNWQMACLAVSNAGYALQHLSPRLRNDIDVVKRAIINNVYAVHHAGDDIKNMSIIVDTVIRQHPSAFWCCFGDDVLTNPKHVSHALQRSESCIRRLPSDSCYSLYMNDPRSQWKNPLCAAMKLRLKHLLNGGDGSGQNDRVLVTAKAEDISRVWSMYEANVRSCIRYKWERAWLVSRLCKEDPMWEGNRGIHKHILNFLGEDLRNLRDCESLIHTLVRLRLPIYD